MSHSASYLRSHRKRSGMNLNDVARLLGYLHGGEISRHERKKVLPSLHIALRYEALYRVPISDLFPAQFEEAKREIEQRLASLIDDCKQSTARGRAAAMIARKIEWAWERENRESLNLFNPGNA